MKEIRLKVQRGIWVAEFFEDGLPSAAVAELFDGEHILPTPFLVHTSKEEVLGELRRRYEDLGVLIS